jgi:hypothetical protein
MKLFTALLFLGFTLTGFTQTFNERVLKAIEEMPKKGGYVLTSVSPVKLRDAFSWNMDELSINQAKAIPSYCTTATYVVFFKVLKSYWAENGYPAKEIQELYRANVESDGVRIWGRWNSNGPGTAKFFHDSELGTNFDDLSKALPGDFLKIWWNDEIGKKESGHSVVFLKSDAATITFWSSNTITEGYGVRTIPKSMAKRLLFSRLERPENAVKMIQRPVTDSFLESMLTRESSWKEVKTVVGIQDSF